MLIGAVVAVASTRSSIDRTVARIPRSLDERWSVSLNAELAEGIGIAATDDTIVVAVDGDPRLVGLDTHSGAERWRTNALRGDVVYMTLVDDAVIALVYRNGQEVLSAFDLADGTPRWSRTIDTSTSWAPLTDAVVGVATKSGRPPVTTRFEVLAPSNGDVIATLVGDDLDIDRDTIQVRENNTAQVYDLATMAPAGAAVNLDILDQPIDADTPVRVADISTGTVVATAQSAVLLDRSGDVISTVELPATDRESGQHVELTAIGDSDYLLVQTMKGVTLLTTADGSLERLWTRAGMLAGAAIDGRDALVALFLPDQIDDGRATGPSRFSSAAPRPVTRFGLAGPRSRSSNASSSPRRVSSRPRPPQEPKTTSRPQRPVTASTANRCGRFPSPTSATYGSCETCSSSPPPTQRPTPPPSHDSADAPQPGQRPTPSTPNALVPRSHRRNRSLLGGTTARPATGDRGRAAARRPDADLGWCFDGPFSA